VKLGNKIKIKVYSIRGKHHKGETSHNRRIINPTISFDKIKIKVYDSRSIKHNRALTLIHERSCEYASFKFVILCALQSPFPNLSLCLSFSSHTFLMAYSEKNLMARVLGIGLPSYVEKRPKIWEAHVSLKPSGEEAIK